MKKLSSILIAMLLALQLCVPVFAAEAGVETGEDSSVVADSSVPEQLEPVSMPEEDSSLPEDSSVPADELDVSSVPVESVPASEEQEQAPISSLPEEEAEAEAQDAGVLTVGRNTWQTAVALQFGVPTAGQTTAAATHDWYKIVVASPGMVQFSFSHAAVASGAWEMELYVAKPTMEPDTSTYFIDQTFLGSMSTQSSVKIGLRAGTYYVDLYSGGSANTALTNLNYTITANYTAGLWEQESNKDYASATPLPLNAVMNGSANRGSDADWYVVTLPSKGLLQLGMSGDVSVTGTRDVSVHQKTAAGYNNSPIISKDFPAAIAQEKLGRVGLPAGTYYIEVYSSSSSLLGLSYQLTAGFTADPYCEAEPNGEDPQANLIKVGQKVKGTIQSGLGFSDYDWYKFTLPSRGVVSLNFTHPAMGNSSIEYWFYAGTSSAKTGYTIGSHKVSSRQTSFAAPKMGLDKGTYYVQLYGGSDLVGLEYVLSYTFEPNKEWEVESNDENLQATKIALGKTVYGSAKTTSDSDYYEFKLTKRQAVNFNFYNTKSSGGKYYISLYRKQGSQYTFALKSTYFSTNKTGSTWNNVTLDAGTYVVWVYASTNIKEGTNYNLTVNVPALQLKSFTLGKSPTTVKVGKAITLKPSAFKPSNTNSSKTGVWKSSNVKYATVDYKGKVTGVKAGTVTITCTIAGKSAKCVVKVQK